MTRGLVSVSAERLRKLRQLRGVSQTEAAGSIGITPGRLSSLETGRTRSVGARTLDALVAYYETHVGYLIGMLSDPAPQASAAAELPPDEQELLQVYRAIQRDSVRDALRVVARQHLALDQSLGGARGGGGQRGDRLTRRVTQSGPHP